MIRKAVFPAAGLATRFLPACKAIPKEMLPVVDKPLIQYAVEEARAAGIEHFVFVTGRNKGAIQDHFDFAAELEATLKGRGRAATIAELNMSLPKAGTTSFTRQQAPLGLGHAIWSARALIGHEPFAVLLPDVLMRGDPGCLAQILQTYLKTGGNVLGVEECSPDQTSKYGIISRGQSISDLAFCITNIVEKPGPGSAPSNFFLNGRYILQPEIFKHLARHDLGAGGEIHLTDAIVRLAHEQRVLGHHFQGRSFDCGSREGFIAANVAFALDDPQLASIVLREVDKFSGSSP